MYLDYVWTIRHGSQSLNTRTERTLNKGMRKLAQRHFSHATSFREMAFQHLDNASKARRKGYVGSVQAYLADAAQCDEMARYIRAEFSPLLPA